MLVSVFVFVLAVAPVGAAAGAGTSMLSGSGESSYENAIGAATTGLGHTATDATARVS